VLLERLSHFKIDRVYQAFLPCKSVSGHSPRYEGQIQGAMQQSLLGNGHSDLHSHSEVDADACFVIWEHEKEALQARLSQQRESLFR
jgi:hypothetical protein